MTIEEYKEKIKELEFELKKKKTDLLKEFVNANNPYKVGDIVTDHIGTILIDKIIYHGGMFGEPPCAIYYGVELKKDGTPNKKGNRRDVFQCNVKNE